MTLRQWKTRAHVAWNTLNEISAQLDEQRQARVIESWNLRPDRSRNPLTAHPRRYWSQADEDGILAEILRRTGPESRGTFLEYGVGAGRECNTLALLAGGWRGAWFGDQELSFSPQRGGRLAFSRAWLTSENIEQITRTALEQLDVGTVDVVSLDLDGNDFHLTKALLASGLRPRAWVSEYNARFPVGVSWVMDYRADHAWSGGDHFGASLTSFTTLFEQHGYFPVACSAQGANAFFVLDDYRQQFLDVPTDLELLYQPPVYTLAPSWGHGTDPRTLSSLTRADPTSDVRR